MVVRLVEFCMQFAIFKCNVFEASVAASRIHITNITLKRGSFCCPLVLSES